MPEKYINLLDTEEKPYLEKPKKKKRFLFWGMIIVLFFLFVACSTYAMLPAKLDNQIAYDPLTQEQIKPDGFFKRMKKIFSNEETIIEEHKKEDRINFLLLGVGGYGHDGGTLADTIMIVSVKPSTEEIALVSIPRDLAVNIPGQGTYKINHTNYFGEKEKKNFGPAFTANILKDTFGVDIHYYLRVDFKAFKEIIDSIGGVKIDVERSFTDTEYPAANYEYQVVSFKKGVQVMSGDTALKYARSRHGNNWEGSDFARSQRQQKVILALKEKLFSLGTLSNPAKLMGIFESVENNIATNLQFGDMVNLLKEYRDIDTSKIITLVLDNSTDGYLKNAVGAGGAYLLKPVTGNFDEISYAIEHIFDEEAEGTEIKKKVETTDDTPEQETSHLELTNIEIQNATWRPGLAARTKTLLDKDEYLVQNIGNTNERPMMESGIYNVKSNVFLVPIVEELQKILEIPIKESVPDGEYVNKSTDILIILGEDYNEKPL